MDFVRGVRIPDNEFPILRSGHQMSSIRRPMHRVYFGQVAFQVASRFHAYPLQLLRVVLGDLFEACVCQIVFLPFDPVLEALRFPSGGRDPGLHLLSTHVVRHRVVSVPRDRQEALTVDQVKKLSWLCAE